MRRARRAPSRRVPQAVLVWQHGLAVAATKAVLYAAGFTAVHTITDVDQQLPR
ncbi:MULTISPECIES: hypothetical protein [unclassified Streptomyces]|uniref:Uncharacterized protein n=1 Tax=Streptomyces sp. NBC_00119 TaxID=2975659 RepID=A0AAU1U0A5_9ACTN|nr:MULTISPECIES: hypothetical protein [unclassified Streptomyces]MCX4648153.1 hypothetical protein [Streptomyces sp. NBC_01446]MCX5323728.1 hypothetical protein [Streptomyces sp. NBC_00120]